MKSTTYALIAVAAIAAFALLRRTLVTCGRLLAISVIAGLPANASFPRPRRAWGSPTSRK